ncbi:hypothetical protein QQF64_022329 [Cirrhinus molitorella]|uniref:Uncharacterized protein n=1 Tax=Cirrhinus molitorella TaxID=172907 RepID=A0ABR3LAH8_9TELE
MSEEVSGTAERQMEREDSGSRALNRVTGAQMFCFVLFCEVRLSFTSSSPKSSRSTDAHGWRFLEANVFIRQQHKGAATSVLLRSRALRVFCDDKRRQRSFIVCKELLLCSFEIQFTCLLCLQWVKIRTGAF